MIQGTVSRDVLPLHGYSYSGYKLFDFEKIFHRKAKLYAEYIRIVQSQTPCRVYKECAESDSLYLSNVQSLTLDINWIHRTMEYIYGVQILHTQVICWDELLIFNEKCEFLSGSSFCNLPYHLKYSTESLKKHYCTY